eukprot:scaffold9851_cov100-Isochrysis_galbana.AAC.2
MWSDLTRSMVACEPRVERRRCSRLDSQVERRGETSTSELSRERWTAESRRDSTSESRVERHGARRGSRLAPPRQRGEGANGAPPRGVAAGGAPSGAGTGGALGSLEGSKPMARMLNAGDLSGTLRGEGHVSPSDAIGGLPLRRSLKPGRRVHTVLIEVELRLDAPSDRLDKVVGVGLDHRVGAAKNGHCGRRGRRHGGDRRPTARQPPRGLGGLELHLGARHLLEDVGLARRLGPEGDRHDGGHHREHQLGPRLDNVVPAAEDARAHLVRGRDGELGVELLVELGHPRLDHAGVDGVGRHCRHQPEQKDARPDLRVAEAGELDVAPTGRHLRVGPRQNVRLVHVQLGDELHEVHAHQLPPQSQRELGRAVSNVGAGDADQLDPERACHLHHVVAVADLDVLVLGRAVHPRPVDAAGLEAFHYLEQHDA